MAKLKIHTYPAPVLRKISEPVKSFGPAEQQLIDDMIETMFKGDGVGLAAPQVGISKRILVAVPTLKSAEAIVFVNPQIYEMSGHEMGAEGCLSFPGLSATVARASRIRVRYMDRKGKPQDIEAKGLFARIIQHEADHLDAVLFIDRIDFDTRHQLLAAYEEL